MYNYYIFLLFVLFSLNNTDPSNLDVYLSSPSHYRLLKIRIRGCYFLETKIVWRLRSEKYLVVNICFVFCIIQILACVCQGRHYAVNVDLLCARHMNPKGAALLPESYVFVAEYSAGREQPSGVHV